MITVRINSSQKFVLQHIFHKISSYIYHPKPSNSHTVTFYKAQNELVPIKKIYREKGSKKSTYTLALELD